MYYLPVSPLRPGSDYLGVPNWCVVGVRVEPIGGSDHVSRCRVSEGGSLHGCGPVGRNGPGCRLAAAGARRSPPGLRHPTAPGVLAGALCVLAGAVLAAMQVPDAAAGLYARGR